MALRQSLRPLSNLFLKDGPSALFVYGEASTPGFC